MFKSRSMPILFSLTLLMLIALFSLPFTATQPAHAQGSTATPTPKGDTRHVVCDNPYILVQPLASTFFLHETITASMSNFQGVFGLDAILTDTTTNVQTTF